MVMMKDIANAAGMSRQVVSLVLNGRDLRYFKDEAAQQMHYYRDALALLNKGRSDDFPEFTDGTIASGIDNLKDGVYV